MIAEAIGSLDFNYGALRKDIYKYIKENFSDKFQNYPSFIAAVYQLKHNGKLIQNDSGYIWVEKSVYDELYNQCNAIQQNTKLYGYSAKQSVGSRLYN